MNEHLHMSDDAEIRDVLKFMAQNLESRPMLHSLVMKDVHRWDRLPVQEKQRVFERDLRRFSVACPLLAQKDRIVHALEILKGGEAHLTSNLFAVA